jgi:hypothetical protein
VQQAIKEKIIRSHYLVLMQTTGFEGQADMQTFARRMTDIGKNCQ